MKQAIINNLKDRAQSAAIDLLYKAGTHVVTSAARKLSDQLVASVEFDARDTSFTWLNSWMTNRGLIKKSNSTVVYASDGGYNPVGNDTILRRVGESEPEKKVGFQHGVGSQVFWYKGFPVLLTRSRPSGLDDRNRSTILDTYTLSTIRSAKHILTELVYEAYNEYKESSKKSITVYSASGTHHRGHWSSVRSMVPRSMDSVILDRRMHYEILDDIREFSENAKWYRENGIPHKRVILLYGPPGTGKTSVIKAIAGEQHMNIYSLSFGGLTDGDINALVPQIEPNSIVLLEDIHAVYEGAVKTEEYRDAEVLTFKGLLNVVDGVMSPENVVFFMTANRTDKFDSALTRRIDKKVYVGYVTRQQTIDLFKKFYPTSHDAGLFAATLENYIKDDACITPAELQEHFVENKDQPELAIANLGEYLDRLDLTGRDKTIPR